MQREGDSRKFHVHALHPRNSLLGAPSFCIMAIFGGKKSSAQGSDRILWELNKHVVAVLGLELRRSDSGVWPHSALLCPAHAPYPWASGGSVPCCPLARRG